MQFPTMKFPKRPAPLSAGVLAATFVGGLAGSVLTLGLVSASPDSPTISGAAALLQPAAAEAHYPSVDLAEIAEKATASVVNISSTKRVKAPGGLGNGEGGGSPFMDDPFFRRFFQLPPGQGIPQERRAQSLGSGVLVDDDGVVLTNNHVVDGADEIKVTLADGREFDAELVGADPQSDVAVIRLQGKPSGLRALPFGDSTRLRLADTVLAIGNPFGVGQTVTMGIVSATGRANLGIADYEDFIQTDAAINPGNSGGALLNIRGELIGINTAIVSRSGGYQGIGFAIPSNMARSIMKSLMDTGTVERGWLGVSIQPLDRDLAEAMGIDQAHGVLVADLTPDGPAKKAGLQRGDVILSIDGKDVKSTGELRNIVASHPAGKSVSVLLVRDGKRLDLDVTLGSLPTKSAPGQPAARAAVKGLLGGVSVSDLGPEVRRKFNIPAKIDEGAVLVEVDPRSAIARAGIAPGDVVIQVGQAPVKDATGFRALASKVEGDSALLLVARESGTIFVLVKK
jgi:serine protease Do